MKEIDGLYDTKEEISIMVNRDLTKDETNQLDWLLEGEIMYLDNLQIQRKLETISTFLIEEKQNNVLPIP